MSIKKLVFSAFVPLILGFLFSCEPGPSLKKEAKEVPPPTKVEVETPKPPDASKNSLAPAIPPAAEQRGPSVETLKTNPANTVKPTNGLPSRPMGVQEILLIKTDADIQSMENRITKMTDEELAQTITNLEKAESEAAKQGKPVPAIHLALAACYGRKGLIDRAYSAIVQAEKAAKAPGVVFSLSAVYGRKELLTMDPRLSPCVMVLESDPPGATVWVDGLIAGTAPTRVEGLRPGIHTVTAELRGYTPYQTSVEGNLGETLKTEARLTPLPVAYTLMLEPDPEVVILDGNPLDPEAHKDGHWAGKVLPGPHRIGARLRGYKDLSSDILVPLGPEPYQATFRLDPQPSVLSVTTNPTDFLVLLNGKKIGSTPLRYQTLEFGEKALTLISNDWRYKDSSPQQIVLNPGVELSLSRDMEKKVGSFTLPEGPSMPAGAKVRLNGTDMGTVPLFNVPLPYGTYSLEIFSPPYEPLIQPIRWEGNPQVIPRALKKPYIEIPVKTIKVDGNLNDWASMDPLLTDPAGNDRMPKEPGTDVIALYMAHDGQNLYWRIDFADGKPQWSTTALDDLSIQCDLVFNSVSYKGIGGYQLDLRVQMNKDGKYFGLYQLHKNETMVAKNENIVYAMGPSFLEARIPLSSIQSMIGGVQSVLVRVYTGPQKVSTYMMTTKSADIQTDFKKGTPKN